MHLYKSCKLTVSTNGKNRLPFKITSVQKFEKINDLNLAPASVSLQKHQTFIGPINLFAIDTVNVLSDALDSSSNARRFVQLMVCTHSCYLGHIIKR